MGRKRKQGIPQLSAEQAAFSDLAEDGSPAAAVESPEDLMRAYLEAETGDLLKKKGVSANSSQALPSARKSQRAGKSGRFSVNIDLHGLTLAESLAQVDLQFRYCFDLGYTSIEALIITGKGLHSGSEGGVLAREVHRHIAKKYRNSILQIEESPAAITLNGIPFRGHFRVILKSDR